ARRDNLPVLVEGAGAGREDEAMRLGRVVVRRVGIEAHGSKRCLCEAAGRWWDAPSGWKVRAQPRLTPVVLVTAAEPGALSRWVPSVPEPRVHAPEGIQAPRIGGVGVVDGGVLERVGARPRRRPLI